MPKLSIAGPNLASGATFHVHKAGCADLRRRTVYKGATVYEEEHEDMKSLVTDFYGDQLAENEGGTWGDYVSEFDIFPCVKGGLPDELAEEVSEGTSESSLLSDQPEVTVVTSSKAAPAKRTAKEAPKVSTKTETKNTRRTWNRSQARKVVQMRNRKNAMSWAAIGNELGFSPRTVRAMFDSVEGTDAHFDNRLPGKGGRIRDGVVLEGERD